MPSTQSNINGVPSSVSITFVNRDDYFSLVVKFSDGSNQDVFEYDSSLFYDGESISFNQTYRYSGVDIIVEFILRSGFLEHYIRRSDNEYIAVDIDFYPYFVDYFSSNVVNQLNGIIDKLQFMSSTVDNMMSGFDIIGQNFTDLTSFVNSKFSNVESVISSQSQSIVSFVNSKSSDILDQINQISQNLSVDLSNISFVSLNGSLGSYKDGSRVSVQGLAGVYVVKSSFMLKNDQNNYIICYQLESEDHSSSLIVPNIFVSLAQ